MVSEQSRANLQSVDPSRKLTIVSEARPLAFRMTRARRNPMQRVSTPFAFWGGTKVPLQTRGKREGE